MILDLGFVGQVVFILMHSERIIFDIVFGGRLTCWNECLFIFFTFGYSELISDDSSVTNLLIDGRIVNKGAIKVC